jgi:predicted O-linked N-acetylglucosamine transferase (SPINDLY family)
MEGNTYLSRQGVTVLTCVGMSELIAQTPEQYIQMALDLGNDIQRLKQLRAGLRDKLKRSPLMSFKTYADELGRAYRRMWREWCERK